MCVLGSDRVASAAVCLASPSALAVTTGPPTFSDPSVASAAVCLASPSGLHDLTGHPALACCASTLIPHPSHLPSLCLNPLLLVVPLPSSLMRVYLQRVLHMRGRDRACQRV